MYFDELSWRIWGNFILKWKVNDRKIKTKFIEIRKNWYWTVIWSSCRLKTDIRLRLYLPIHLHGSKNLIVERLKYLVKLLGSYRLKKVWFWYIWSNVSNQQWRQIWIWSEKLYFIHLDQSIL
jgi:hypothetical protein